MPALVAGIHVLRLCGKDVDGRDKPGHDGGLLRRGLLARAGLGSVAAFVGNDQRIVALRHFADRNDLGDLHRNRIGHRDRAQLRIGARRMGRAKRNPSNLFKRMMGFARAQPIHEYAL